MSEVSKPVVVYGASGSTGALICEYLREYEIPFIAAGRNEEKIKATMEKVPGIETADFEVKAVDHNVEALAELFSGSQVVCNVVGPFEYYGEVVVEAALKAGCHYIDTTGEPSFMKRVKENFGPAYEKAGLALAPSTAYMYVPLEICSRMCLEDKGIDSLEAVSCSNGVPTYASTQSIFTVVGAEATFLQDNQRVAWPPAKGYEVNMPGFILTQLAHPWGGGSLPLWFEDNFQVRNCRQLTFFPDRPMIEGMLALEEYYHAEVKDLPAEEQKEVLSAMADEMQPSQSPRENRLIHRCTDHVVGTGNGIQRSVTMRSGPAYLQTGLIHAAISFKLINEGTDKTGFVSPCEMVGHEYMLSQLKRFFPIEIDVA